MNDNPVIALCDFVSAYDSYQRMRAELLPHGATLARDLRHTTRLSMRKFAALCGVSVPYLSKVENGHFPLSVELARKMLEVYRTH